jgi:hypothetical protein
MAVSCRSQPGLWLQRWMILMCYVAEQGCLVGLVYEMHFRLWIFSTYDVFTGCHPIVNWVTSVLVCVNPFL